MCRRVGIDPLSGARTVRLLRKVGAVAVDSAAEAGSEHAGPRPPIARSARRCASACAPT